ncbi:mannosyltransferase [Corynebacterium suranareeae]|uniref:Mannosyltransferase n=1 Tax=Corynebacterium suranareeae TaxID=2506452 RepID=A0A169RPK6_9CORY|nr:hypothetical protein [Corynebacterium suranareeae]BAU94758.1 mannosyltransferase [Corynebacterium suranareeae]
MSRQIVVDKAGATKGGARRFLLELEDYLENHPRPEVSLIGGERLSSKWLIKRELCALKSERIALNNASFALPGRHKTVLLRNALHFASDSEFKELNYTPSEHMKRQIPVIRFLAKKADSIIVPCSAMAERVSYHEPTLENRIKVMFHPVSPRGWASVEPDQNQKIILVPVIPQSYKRLDFHIPRILKAAEGTGVKIAVTSSPGEIPAADGHPQYLPIGKMPAEQLASWWGKSAAIYFPPSLESFGYALAEARCGGRPVIAPNTGQNREIAGSALFSYKTDLELREAVIKSVEVSIEPDPLAFSPNRYFADLFSENY